MRNQIIKAATEKKPLTKLQEIISSTAANRQNQVPKPKTTAQSLSKSNLAVSHIVKLRMDQEICATKLTQRDITQMYPS